MMNYKKLREKLNDINLSLGELEDGIDIDPSATLEELENLKEQAQEIGEELDMYEYRGNNQEDAEYDRTHHLYKSIMGNIRRIYRECGGYDAHDMLQMMYPDEDVDSEDFEDGFDLEDFYED